MDASWDRFLGGFWRILGAKMEPCWHQNRTQNPCEHRNAILRKSCSHSCGGVNFLGPGVQVGRKNRSKIEQKGRSTWEGILASIFGGFWWIFGGKLGSKIDQKSIQEGIEKTMEKWKAPRWPQDADRRFQRVAKPGVQSPGEGLPH